jgi:hypothetical protein
MDSNHDKVIQSLLPACHVVTESDIYPAGERIGLSALQFRKLLSLRYDSLGRMQRAFIRIGIAPEHSVRLALNDQPLEMFTAYKDLR